MIIGLLFIQWSEATWFKKSQAKKATIWFQVFYYDINKFQTITFWCHSIFSLFCTRSPRPQNLFVRGALAARQKNGSSSSRIEVWMALSTKCGALTFCDAINPTPFSNSLQACWYPSSNSFKACSYPACPYKVVPPCQIKSYQTVSKKIHECVLFSR